MRALAFVAFIAASAAAQQSAAPITAIRAGRLIDPDAGTVAANQIILVQDKRITAVGPNVAIPAGANVIDLSTQTVLPGLVDSHNHLALTYKEEPERNIYYLTYVTPTLLIHDLRIDGLPGLDSLVAYIKRAAEESQRARQ